MNMIERVARAMCTAAMIDPDWCDEPLSARGDKPQWQNKAPLARAAIAAMREPTPGMVEAAWLEVMQEDAGDVWRAMVDQVLVSSPAVPASGEGEKT